MLFLLLLLSQKFYFFRREPFTIIFWPTFSKMSVFRFDISVLQIMLSPTPLRWLDYSIFRRKCQKIFVCVFSCLCSIWACFTLIFHKCYIYITFMLQHFHFSICAYSSNTFSSISQFFNHIFYSNIFVLFCCCNFFCNY